MILLVPLLFPLRLLLTFSGLLLLPLNTLDFPFLLLVRFALGLEVWILLYLRLIETVHDGILPYWDVDFAYGTL